MNIINIADYEILNFGKDNLVVSEKGVSKIKSPSMLTVLRKLQAMRTVTSETLEEVLRENGLEPDKAYDFLDRTISLYSARNIYFEKVLIVHGWKGKAPFEALLREESETTLDFFDFSHDLIKLVGKARCFVVLVCDEYDYKKVRKLYFDLAAASPESAISVYWPMGRFFCLGQPYIKVIGNPCHFCTVDRLMIDALHESGNGNWAKLLAFCKSRHSQVPFRRLSLFQEMIVIGAMSRKINFFIGSGSSCRYQDDVLCSSYVQLTDGSVTEQVVAHWCQCDCVGGRP